jgi:outer membrane protein
MQKRKPGSYALVVALFLCASANAQTPIDTLIDLNGALQLAIQHYHLLKAKGYESQAAAKSIDVEKYSKWPSIDISYNANLATANNLTGMFYPTGILPITGPPSTSNSPNPATGSAAGLLLNWQAITFGQRNAQIDVSVVEANSKNLEYQQEVFRHQINVISVYLDLLLAYDIVSIHQQNIDRVLANLKQSRTLVNTGIKPAVDTALFLSELSKAKIGRLNAERQLKIQQWQLAQLIVTPNMPVPTDTSFLNRLPAEITTPDTGFSNHPLILYSKSLVELNRSRETLLKKSFLPKLTVWGAAFARGSGFQPDGTIKTWDGLALNRYNYGAGIQLAFPIMKYGDANRQRQQQSFLSNAAQERLEESKLELTTQLNIANTTFNSSLAIASETQQQFKSGRYAFTAMQVRYNTGLVNFADLIQAQYNLLTAELEIRKAYWEAWKALLLQAAVKGDANVFLNEIK